MVLETAIHKLGQGTTYRRARVSDHARDRKAIETSVRRTTVPVEIDLGRVDLTLGEILALSEGDVLRIHSVEDAKASAIVEGVARMIGSPGRSHGNLAFRVESIRRDVNDEGRRKS